MTTAARFVIARCSISSALSVTTATTEIAAYPALYGMYIIIISIPPCFESARRRRVSRRLRPQQASRFQKTESSRQSDGLRRPPAGEQMPHLKSSPFGGPAASSDLIKHSCPTKTTWCDRMGPGHNGRQGAAGLAADRGRGEPRLHTGARAHERASGLLLTVRRKLCDARQCA